MLAGSPRTCPTDLQTSTGPIPFVVKPCQARSSQSNTTGKSLVFMPSSDLADRHFVSATCVGLFCALCWVVSSFWANLLSNFTYLTFCGQRCSDLFEPSLSPPAPNVILLLRPLPIPPQLPGYPLGCSLSLKCNFADHFPPVDCPLLWSCHPQENPKVGRQAKTLS
jgi:hypothetical protein